MTPSVAKVRPTARHAFRRAVQELEVGRREIREGRFQRSMAAITGVSAVVSGFEAYVQHRRGAFDHWLMWTPIWLMVPTGVVAGGALFSERMARRALPALSVITMIDGVVGFGYHLRGIRRMPGGFSLGQYNVVMGPPLFAPLLMCSVAVSGMLGGMLRRERSESAALRWSEAIFGWLRLRSARRRGLGARRRLRERVAQGRFQQVMALTAGSFAVLAGGEAYFEHLRGSFNERLMWTPVWLTPPMAAASLGAVFSARVAEQVLPVTSAAVFLDGLLGFGLHLRGIKRMPGGFRNLDFNFALGPPLFAPLLLCSVGLLGFGATLLRRAHR